MKTLVAFLAALALAAPARAAVELHASVAPRVVGLGDPFTYTVEATGDVTLVADTGPFVAVAPPKRTRSGETVRIEQRLVCVDRTCAPNEADRSVLLPRARAIDNGVQTVAAPVAITLRPRVPRRAVTAARARYRVEDAVPAISKPWAGATTALLVLALAAIAGAVYLVWPRRAQVTARRGDRRRGGIERALRLLRESARRPPPDRRRAADLVARAAAERGAAPAAADATRIAWSAPDPAPPEVTELADRVQSAVGGDA